MLYYTNMNTTHFLINRFPRGNLETSLLFFSLCATFFLLAINHGFYTGLYVCGFSSLLLLIRFIYKIKLTLYSYFIVFLPFLLCLYVIVTPGHFFKDMPVGECIFFSYISGLGAAIFCKEKEWDFVCSLLAGILFSLLIYVLLGFPDFMKLNGRLMLLFFHPSVLANVCSLMFIYFYYQYRHVEKKKQIVSFLGIVTGLIVVVFCVSRATYAALLGSFIYLTIIMFRKYALRIGIVLVLCLSIFSTFLSFNQRERIISALKNPFGDVTFLSRQPIWDAAISGFEESPWLGNGLRSFKVYHGNFIKENDKELRQKYPAVEQKIANPHNLYLGLLFAYGIIGVLLFMGAIFPALWISIVSKNYLFPAIILFYLIYGLFEYQLHRKDGIFLLFFPLGIVYGRYFMEKLQRHPPAQPQNSP